MNINSFIRNRNNRNSWDDGSYREFESKNILKAYHNKQPWNEYLETELRELHEIIDYFSWPRKMIKHFKYIISSTNEIEFQSKFFYDEYSRDLQLDVTTGSSKGAKYK